MRYLHTMLRIKDLKKSLDFYLNILDLKEVYRNDYPKGRFTLIYLAASKDFEKAKKNHAPLIELTYNWDPEDYNSGRNFGHLAFEVDDIYKKCQHILDHNITLNRPPRDGKMAFIQSLEGISIEFLQKGEALPIIEPWCDMENIGNW